MTIEEIQKEIIDEFDKCESWFDKRKHLVQLGKDMPFPNKARTSDDNLIRGCQVSTWFYSEFRDGKMFYEIDSASAVVKGIAVLMTRVFSGQSPQDICRAELIFIEGAGLKEDFSPVRANSLLKMLGRIKSDAEVRQTRPDAGAAAGSGKKANAGLNAGLKGLIKKIYAKMRNAS